MRCSMFRFAGCLAVLAALSACGDDPQGYEIWLQPQETRLPADGSASTELLISVLNADLTPVPIGSRVAILCVDSESQPAGIFQGGDEGQTAVFLDGVGSASLRISCTGEPTEDDFLLCIARFEGEQVRANAPINCEAVTPPSEGN